MKPSRVATSVDKGREHTTEDNIQGASQVLSNVLFLNCLP